MEEVIKKETQNIIESKKALSIGEDNVELIGSKLQKFNGVADIIKKELVNGVDYMVIPNTNKPSLLKSGAQKIALLYGLVPDYNLIMSVSESSEKTYKYGFKCELKTYDGKKVAEGYGLASSYEIGFQRAKASENTILKMAEKRAFVDAVTSIGNLSKVFTQDMEEELEVKKIEINKNNKEQKLTKEEAWRLFSLFYKNRVENWEALDLDHKKELKEVYKNELYELLQRYGYNTPFEVILKDYETIKLAIIELCKQKTNKIEVKKEDDFSKLEWDNEE